MRHQTFLLKLEMIPHQSLQKIISRKKKRNWTLSRKILRMRKNHRHFEAERQFLWTMPVPASSAQCQPCLQVHQAQAAGGGAEPGIQQQTHPQNEQNSAVIRILNLYTVSQKKLPFVWLQSFNKWKFFGGHSVSLVTRIKAASYQFLYTGSMSDSPKLDFPILD